jgi:hypothetical protein
MTKNPDDAGENPMEKRHWDALVVPNQGFGDLVEHIGMTRYVASIYTGKVFFFVNSCGNWPVAEWMYRDNPRIKVCRIGVPGDLGRGPRAGTRRLKDLSYNFYRWSQRTSDFANIESGSLVSDKLTCINQTHHIYGDKHTAEEHGGLRYGESFYKTAGIPYQIKFNNFYVEREHEEEDRVYKKLNPNNEKYIFVHDLGPHGKRGRYCGIDAKIHTRFNEPIKVIRNDPSENPFHQIKLYEKAEEIHCMSSSIMILIDSMAASPMKTNLNEKPKFLHWYIRRRAGMNNHGEQYFGSNWNVVYNPGWRTVYSPSTGSVTDLHQFLQNHKETTNE